MIWSFDDGVITLQNSFKDFNEMVVLELTANKFLFRAKYDVDENGNEDILQFLAKPYRPNETYFYSNNLLRDESQPNKINLTWSEYDGINQFQRYELYLSGPNCQLGSAKLLTTITDAETTSFEDLDPPLETFYCYFLKVYADKGLLFESYSVGISSEYLPVPGVTLENPTVQNETISLQWEKYEGLYFSHYEVVVKNYVDGYGSIYQELPVITISDINTTSFLDEQPPIIKNPVYEVRVFNKFGKQNYYNSLVVVSAKATTHQSERVIDVQNIQNFVPSPSETVVFLNGGTTDTYENYITRYNYVTQTVEAISNTQTNLGGSTKHNLKVINSSAGQEVLYTYYDGIDVFNAQTLQYKYTLNLNNSGALEDYIYLRANRFVLIDDQHAYSVLRDFSNLTVLDKQEHYMNGQSQNWYGVFNIEDNKVLIGNSDYTESVIFSITAEGNLVDRNTIEIPITAILPGQTTYKSTYSSIVNFNENRIYDINLATYQSFEQPYFALNLSLDGSMIMGTNNNPDWDVNPNSVHEKKVRILDLNSRNLKTVEVTGYPHYLFENHLGQLVSLSTYFKRPNAKYSYERPDFFIEILPQ